MPTCCFQLLYFSRGRNDLRTEDIDEILETAHATNPGLEITGLLLFEQGHFLQLLEGPEANVRALYQRIANDPRHSGSTIIFTRTVSERDFANWNMAKADIDQHQGDLHAAFEKACSSGAAPEITVHRRSSAKQLLDFFKALLDAPPTSREPNS